MVFNFSKWSLYFSYGAINSRNYPEANVVTLKF